MKKVLSVVAVSILVLFVLAFSVSATSGSCGTNVTWSFDATTGTLTISGKGEVTSSPWSSYSASVKNIVVGNSITKINKGIFYGCNAVEEMTVPFIGEKENAIGSAAVLGYVFGYTAGDYDMDWPSYESFGFGVQYVEYNTQSYTAGGHEHFDYIHRPFTYYLPKTLKKVTLTKGIARGFTNSGVTTLVLGPNVNKIVKGAFTATSALTDIEILGVVPTIEDDALVGSGFYSDADNWENGVLYLGRHLVEFTDKTATEYTVREDTRAIAYMAFEGCSKLEKVILPEDIDLMPHDVFSGCTSMKEMTVPFGGIFVPKSTEILTILSAQIHNECFKGYYNLKEVILKDGVTSIGSNAFENCSSLSVITIPRSVTAFGNDIFNSAVTICGENGSVAQWYAEENNIPFVTCIHSFGDWMTDEDNNAYRVCSKCGEKESAVLKGECGDGLTWTLNKITKEFSIVGEGEMYSYSDTVSPWILEAAHIETVTIEDGVTSIGCNAFKNCSFVKTIDIPQSVTLIHNGAISDCSNATVNGYVGSYAEDYAVRHNFAFECLDIPDKMGANWSYYETYNRLNVYGNGTVKADSAWSEFAADVKSVWVADSVTEIVKNAFKEFTSLEEIKLPFIGKSADAETYESVFGYIFGYQTLLGYLYYDPEGNWQSPLTTYQYTEDTYINGELDTDYSNFYCYYIPKTLKKVIFTGDSLPERAFYNYSMLTNVTALNTTSIGSDAFKKSGATVRAYANSAVHTYATKNSVPFDAYCTDETGHNGTETVTPPTCSAQGYTQYTCEICNYSYKDNYVDTVSHDYESVVTAPTCTVAGYTTHTCKNCGDSYTSDSVKETGHSYGQWIANTSGNYSYRVCSICDNSVTRTSSGLLTETITWFIDFNTDTLYLSGTGATPDYTSTTYNILGQNALYYKHVVVEEGITAIGSYTFKHTKLESVSLPSTLTAINDFGFSNCTALKKVTIPDLSQWLSIDFATYTQNPLYPGNANLYIGDELLEKLVVPEKFTTVKPYSFAGCTSLKSVVLPSTILNIDNASFHGCKALTSITFSESMTNIASNAFHGCTALEEVTIPENITKINYNAFKGCTALKKATVLLSTTSFGSAVFNGCTNLTIYSYEGSRAQAYAEKNSIPFVVITEGECTEHDFGTWTVSGTTATRKCSNCTETETLTVGGSCGTNATWLLNPNTGLLTVSGSGAMAKYSTTSAAPWSSLADRILSVEINGITSVGNYAFINCTSLESVVLADSVESIEAYAFSTCTALKEVTVGKGLTKSSTRAFINCTAIEKVHVPSLDMWCGISFLTVESNPASVSGAFYVDGKHITEAVIGDSVMSIGDYAFRYADFTSITLPEGLTSIGKAAFAYCNGITEITIPEGVTVIPTSAFKDCSKLVTAVLPNGVTSINNQAFQNCASLETIVIPETVTSIYDTAFGGCDKLTIKGYAGSYAETFADEYSIPFVALSHNFGEWEIIESTCTVQGRKTKYCSTCGAVETEILPILGHSFGGWTVTEPTCTKDGKQFRICENCGEVEAESISSPGHKFDEWIITEATCTTDGEKTRTCTVCGETETEIITANGHDYVETVVPPTCTDAGHTEYVCDVCGDSYVDNKTEATGHKFGDWITDTEPTTTQEGSKHRTCGVCSETETEIIPKLEEDKHEAVYTLSSEKAKPGETVKLTLSLKSGVEINSIALSGFTYDSNLLEFVGFGDYAAIEEMPILTATFDDEKEYILIGFTEPFVFDGDICTLEFKVKEDAETTSVSISATPVTKCSSTVIESELVSGEVDVYIFLKGDIDGDDDVDLDDAVYLFGYSMLPDFYITEYPGDMDFDHDGDIDIDDAILLFNYSMLPDLFPLD